MYQVIRLNLIITKEMLLNSKECLLVKNLFYFNYFSLIKKISRIIFIYYINERKLEIK
jgi:hypothetical protein